MEFTTADVNLAKGIAKYFDLKTRPDLLGKDKNRKISFYRSDDICYCFCYLYRWFNRINGWTGKNSHLGSIWKNHLRAMANEDN